MPSNDEAERRGIAPTTNEADLSQSSTLSEDATPRSLQPIVRSHLVPPATHHMRALWDGIGFIFLAWYESLPHFIRLKVLVEPRSDLFRSCGRHNVDGVREWPNRIVKHCDLNPNV